MGKCAVKNCKNLSQSQNKSDGITFHKVPKDLERRIKWTKIIRLLRKETDWIPTRTTTICSKHFREQDKIKPDRDSGRVRLTDKAIPILVDESQVDQEHVGEDMNVDWIDDLETDDEMEEITGPSRKHTITKKINLIKSESTNSTINLNGNTNKQPQSKNKSKVGLQSVIDELKRQRLLSEEEEIQLNVNDETIQLMSEFEEAFEKKRTFRNMPYALMKFALTLNFYSPAAYEYVRAAFNNSLPQPRRLYKWYSKTNGDPGFTSEAFNFLKVRSDSSKSKIVCNLVIDEMAIHQDKIDDGKRHLGYVDFGLNDNISGQNLASSALVLLLVCLNDTWKIPIGYFYTHGIMSDKLANIINLALAKCAEVNVEVASVTCDGSQTNIAAMRVLGCKLNDPNSLKTTFTHPTTKNDVVLLLDPYHMMKLVRNTFASKKVFLAGNEEVNWKYVKRLKNIQDIEELRTEKKLMDHHIYFRNQNVQVKLASQLLSNSVAQSLCMAKYLSAEFENCKPTAEFIKLHNDVFDLLNSKRDSKAHGFHKTLNPETKYETFNLIEKYINYIKKLKFQTVLIKTAKRKGQIHKVIMTNNIKNVLDCTFKTGFLGLLVCLESLKILYVKFVESGLLKDIATYRLSQDHLEMLFNCIRQKVEHKKKPNVVQFKTAYKAILQHLELTNSFRENYISFEKFNTLCRSGSKKDHIEEINRSSNDRYDNSDFKIMNLQEDLDKSTKQIEKQLESLWMEQQTISSLFTDISKLLVGYISGYVVHRVGRQLKCEICIKAMLASEQQWFHKLVAINDNKVGLCYTSRHVFDICLSCEGVIRHAIALSRNLFGKSEVMRLATTCLNELQSNRLIKEFAIHSGDYLSTIQIDHSLFLINAIIHKYIEIRLQHESKLHTSLSR